MNLDKALTQAHAMSGARPRPNGTPPKGAARLYADIEYELAMGEPTPEQEQAGERALAVLEEHFHGIKDASDTVVENGHIPRMSRKAKDQALGAPETRQEGGGTATATRPTTVPKPARQAVKRARAARSAPRAAAHTAGRSLSIVNQATGSWGDDAWIFVLGGFGLAFLFLVLTHPQGLRNLATGASNLTRWVIDPTIDPLRPTTTGAKR